MLPFNRRINISDRTHLLRVYETSLISNGNSGRLWASSFCFEEEMWGAFRFGCTAHKSRSPFTFFDRPRTSSISTLHHASSLGFRNFDLRRFCSFQPSRRTLLSLRYSSDPRRNRDCTLQSDGLHCYFAQP
jgi:hypothetical protein